MLIRRYVVEDRWRGEVILRTWGSPFRWLLRYHFKFISLFLRSRDGAASLVLVDRKTGEEEIIHTS